MECVASITYSRNDFEMHRDTIIAIMIWAMLCTRMMQERMKIVNSNHSFKSGD